jgi:hypothetical protein
MWKKGDTFQDSTIFKVISGVCNATNVFVIVNDNGILAFSTDGGRSWEESIDLSYLSIDKPIINIAYGNNYFFAMSPSETYFSYDLARWGILDTEAFGTSYIYDMVHVINSEFIACASDGKIGYSFDNGISWEVFPVSEFGGSSICKLCKSNYDIIAFTDDGKIGYYDIYKKDAWTVYPNSIFGKSPIKSVKPYREGFIIASSEKINIL